MQKIIFFGGKGGVGKTSCSTAFAMKKAKEGLSVLLVSTDPAHSISDLLNIDINDKIKKIKKNLFATEIDAQKESEKYINSIKSNLKSIVSPIIIEQIKKQLDAASVSPGAHESALFDKMLELIITKSKEYDLIVFDTAPTGHTVRLLSLPEILGKWIDSLLKKRRKMVKLKSMVNKVNKNKDEDDPILGILNKRKEKTEKAREILIDNKALSFIFVLNAEKLPIMETKKAIDILKKYDIEVNNLVINKLLPDNLSDDFFVKKKKQEKKYIKMIENMNVKKIYKIPLFQKDMDENSIDEMVKYF